MRSRSIRSALRPQSLGTPTFVTYAVHLVSELDSDCFRTISLRCPELRSCALAAVVPVALAASIIMSDTSLCAR